MQSKVKRAFGSLASSPEIVPLILVSSSALFDASSFGVRGRREELVTISKHIRSTDFEYFPQINLKLRMGQFHACSVGK